MCYITNRSAECSHSEILSFELTPRKMQRYNGRMAGVVSTGVRGERPPVDHLPLERCWCVSLPAVAGLAQHAPRMPS